MIDTTRVKDRRTIRYESLDSLDSDVRRLVELDRAGQLTALGNWTLGQALGHLAGWIEFAYTGLPIKPPMIIRLLTRPFKRRFLTKGLGPGVRITRDAGGTLAVEQLSLNEGRDRFTRAVARLRAEAPTLPNALFGPLTHEEWIALQLRHAELHLSFFKPKP